MNESHDRRPGRPARHRPRARQTAFVGAVATVVAVGVAGCASAPPAAPPEPVVDVEQASLRAVSATQLEAPARIIFDWQSQEPGRRFEGRGVARVEPRYHARLDLFRESLETVVRAALVEGDLRMAADVSDDILPPPRLLWAAIGVVRPGTGYALLGAERVDDDGLTIRYGYPGDEELRYTLEGQRLRRVELLRGSDVVETVELEVDPESRFPRSAVYRHLADFRELRLERDSLELVEPFPPDIWNPGR